MTLESTMLCVDNSEYSRNGDFTPTRLGAQQDVIQTVSRAKIRINAENNFGLLACAGKKPKLINTLTQDTNKVLSSFSELDYEGEKNNFSTTLKTAMLALKHRQGKNHRQRIVIMVCSPLAESEPELVRLAKKLKKDKVNVDVVNFGEEEKNVELLSKFIETLNGKVTDPSSINCHLINVTAGQSLNDGVRMSAICGNDPAQSSGNAGMEMDADWMDDPNMDPDLALALRVSLEESRARQQAEQNSEPANIPETVEENAAAENEEAEELNEGQEDELLMRALEMSLVEGMEEGGEAIEENSEEEPEMTEEEQIELALRLSMQAENDDANEKEEGMEDE